MAAQEQLWTFSSEQIPEAGAALVEYDQRDLFFFLQEIL